MIWVVYVLLMLMCGLCGFFVGVAYGQEHPNE